MDIQNMAAMMKKASPVLASSSKDMRDSALLAMKDAINKNAYDIYKANESDMENAIKDGVSDAVIKRLKFDEHKLKDVTDGLDMLISLPDPLGKVTLHRQLDKDLILSRITCPIGVIGVIFEARPDALIQIASLCIKSGNTAILKGGSETRHTNKVLFDILKDAITGAGLPEGSLYQAESHSDIDELLTCDKYIDLIIPRGSNSFVRYIMEHTSIPVMGHSDGICHIYVDKSADKDMAIRVIKDAKVQYSAACNAVETVLIDSAIADEFIPDLVDALSDASVSINGTKAVADIAGDINICKDDDFEREYLAPELGVKIVDGIDQAIEHINTHGSHHTDAIMAEDDEVAERFMQMVDSAGVYRNCSTRFADGFRYGFGAEVGISTAKLHARGPVGLDGLVTYKYKLEGHYQIVGDYASGKERFHHKDL